MDLFAPSKQLKVIKLLMIGNFTTLISVVIWTRLLTRTFQKFRNAFYTNFLQES
jgi:hypothetical protein